MDNRQSGGQRVLSLVIPFILIAFGVGALVFGLLRGETAFIYNVATTICFSCIGIG